MSQIVRMAMGGSGGSVEPSAMGIVKGRESGAPRALPGEAEPERGSMAKPLPSRSASPLDSSERSVRADPVGFLNMNKPVGWTSHDVVARVRTLLRTGAASPKVGHVGTLDPSATGVLPLCVGKATKVAQYLIEWDKSYRAVMKLGERTDTQDATGKQLDTAGIAHLDHAQIESACAAFVGPIQQLPPMYSAVKVGGAPLYKAARAGLVVERAPRAVVISLLRVLEIDGALVTMDVDCSKGTYIRTLCADIGDRLGVGAHLFRLERRRAGSLTLDGAITMDELEAAVASGSIESFLIPIDRVLSDLPQVLVDEATAERVCHGIPLPSRVVAAMGSLPAGQAVRIATHARELIAIGRAQPGERSGTSTTAPSVRIETVLAARSAGEFRVETSMSQQRRG
jgi:tRNA pseudouridine55 synthase